MIRERMSKPKERELPNKSEYIEERLNKKRFSRRSLIQRMATIGCTEAEIMTVLNLTRNELNIFRPALDLGRAFLRTSLRHKQYQQALKGNTTMLIWLGKQILGQREDPGAPSETTNLLEQLVKVMKEGPVKTATAGSE